MARPPLLSAASGKDRVPEPEPRRGRSPSPPQPPLGVPAPRIAARRSRSAARQSEPRPPSAGTARGSPCCRAPSIPRAAAGNGDHFRRGAAGYHGNRPAGVSWRPVTTATARSGFPRPQRARGHGRCPSERGTAVATARARRGRIPSPCGAVDASMWPLPALLQPCSLEGSGQENIAALCTTTLLNPYINTVQRHKCA